MYQILKLLGSLAGVVLLLSGCASLTDRKRHQYVYIQSTPPQAVVLDKGQNIGSTPGLIRLPRNKTYELELQRAGEKRSLVLKTHYAWNESFYGNLIFSSLAPIGWITDLVTGAAWNYEDPEPAEFSKNLTVKSKPSRLALAPPVASTFGLSDEAAQYWEKQLPKLYPEAQLIPFKQSLSAFQESGYDHDERPNDEQNFRQLLFNLHADRVFVSEVRERQDGVQLRGHLIDLSGKVFEEKFGEASLVKSATWKGSVLEMIPSWFQFVPNTVGVEFSNTQTYLSDTIVSYQGVETGRKTALGNTLSYLQALTLSRLQMPRFDRSARWKFQFTPSARLSYKTIFFPAFEKLAYVNFDYFQAGIGIGPEFGYQAGKHYTYMKGIPLWTYSQMDWNQPGGHAESMSRGVIDFQFELGYLYFLSDSMSIRFFTKSTSSNIDLWNSVAQKVNPTTPPLTSANDSYAGIAFGYSFDFRERLVSK